MAIVIGLTPLPLFRVPQVSFSTRMNTHPALNGTCQPFFPNSGHTTPTGPATDAGCLALITLSGRIDPSYLLLMRGRCLTIMLPVGSASGGYDTLGRQFSMATRKKLVEAVGQRYRAAQSAQSFLLTRQAAQGHGDRPLGWRCAGALWNSHSHDPPAPPAQPP